MNTTTNTRGASEAMDRAEMMAVVREARMHMQGRLSTQGAREITDRRLAALEAALSAEPAAQGDGLRDAVGRFLRAYIGKYGRRITGHGAFVDVRQNAPMYDEALALNSAYYTAPPAQPAERVPEGMVPVPREPTDAMLSCLIDGAPSSWKEGTVAEFYGTREDMAENYKAMLAASPAPSEGGKGVDGLCIRNPAPNAAAPSTALSPTATVYLNAKDAR